tara:strand:- start:864 stop:1076 length:213 start_codon:yes stop_codon:yes gene_type:complete
VEVSIHVERYQLLAIRKKLTALIYLSKMPYPDSFRPRIGDAYYRLVELITIFVRMKQPQQESWMKENQIV